MNIISKTDILKQQAECLRLHKAGNSQMAIAKELGLSRDQVRARITGAKKLESLDPALAERLLGQGLTNFAGLHSGWLMGKDGTGSGSSLYFMLGPDQEKISFADALVEVLSDIPKLDPVVLVQSTENAEHVKRSKDYATWVALADLHVGGDYGALDIENDFTYAIDDLVSRLPPAEHAVLFELGDILEANDHKGLTPQSGNLLDVRREDHLKNTMTAVRLMRHAIRRLLETHQTVEVHLLKGNHDPTAYIAVMLSLEAHFENNPRVNIVVSDAEYRTVMWGECAAFPNHGDKLNWGQLKDVWTDMFADAWAEAKAHRLIMTAHFHHDRKRDLVGCTAEHYRTLHKPNNWAIGRGLLSRGSLTAMTVHRHRGEEYRTISNIRNVLHG